MGKRFSPPTRSRAGERPARTLRHAMCHKKSFDGVFPLALFYSVGAQTPANPPGTVKLMEIWPQHNPDP
ncbi:hypothetical protein [Candidatus Bandiella numerosa]|uniref:hypothetical protein n=1 Tax=Candidatus Bandiella numerosa TaxID=2570586 RepID=UPI001F3E9E48|nr:hypothetical protein [Candidatus Bandiella numerosa]